jgi:hypothetical protein
MGSTFRVLCKHNIETVGVALKKVVSFLRPVKDDLDLKTPAVYSIPSECGEFCYTAQTESSLETMVQNHHRHIGLYHSVKWALARRIINLGRRIQFHNTSNLAMKPGHMEHIIREVAESEQGQTCHGSHSFTPWPLIHTLTDETLQVT